MPARRAAAACNGASGGGGMAAAVPSAHPPSRCPVTSAATTIDCTWNHAKLRVHRNAQHPAAGKLAFRPCATCGRSPAAARTAALPRPLLISAVAGAPASMKVGVEVAAQWSEICAAHVAEVGLAPAESMGRAGCAAMSGSGKCCNERQRTACMGSCYSQLQRNATMLCAAAGLRCRVAAASMSHSLALLPAT